MFNIFPINETAGMLSCSSASKLDLEVSTLPKTRRLIRSFVVSIFNCRFSLLLGIINCISINNSAHVYFLVYFTTCHIVHAYIVEVTPVQPNILHTYTQESLHFVHIIMFNPFIYPVFFSNSDFFLGCQILS